MECYFTFEKQPHSNSLIITETFYDNPRVFEDARKGVHTTALGKMMQNLILSTLQKNQLYSKRDMLLEMGLISRNSLSNQTTSAAWDYCNKFYRLLDSAVNQLNKKGSALIVPVLVDRITKAVVAMNPERIAQYDVIAKTVCKSIGANSVADVYRKGMEKEFWQLMDKAVCEQMGYQGIIKKLLIEEIYPQKAAPVDRRELIQCAADTVYNNYAHGHKGVIGIERIKAAPEKCQKYHDELLGAAP